MTKASRRLRAGRPFIVRNPSLALRFFDGPLDVSL